MADYLSKVDTGILSFLSEVSKEVIHQATGYEFEVKKNDVNVLADTSQAYGEAIGSAISQQMALDEELAQKEDDFAGEYSDE